MKFEKVRDAEHYRRMFSRGDPTVGASLAARALCAAHPGADRENATRYFLKRHPQGVPAVEVLRLMNCAPSRLPEGVCHE
ncbi:MAG: hypothetical protein KA184_11815 [Candidatus Hydrogenedentes bacterium]|nr:hypothetical protein [Candidatus Hydrogenedentota bacterium]